jgi:hypothetical protein
LWQNELWIPVNDKMWVTKQQADNNAFARRILQLPMMAGGVPQTANSWRDEQKKT